LEQRSPFYDLRVELNAIAHPRGDRSLNGGRNIPLPATLSFVEDMPVVNQGKIWAYADSTCQGWLVVVGEKGDFLPA
jgi:hypothetical protein